MNSSKKGNFFCVEEKARIFESKYSKRPLQLGEVIKNYGESTNVSPREPQLPNHIEDDKDEADPPIPEIRSNDNNSKIKS